MRILCLAEYYRPGFRYGGPITSVGNMAEALGDKLQFLIITRNHDYGVNTPYEGIPSNTWTKFGRASVFYADESHLRPWKLRKIAASIDYDCLYLNSAFLPWLSFFPVLMTHLRLMPERPIVIAPRGCFAPGSMAVRSLKKFVFLEVCRRIGCHRDITWHAGSESEKECIQTYYGKSANIAVVEDIVSDSLVNAPLASLEKRPGELKIVFISRIDHLKNLLWAIDLVKRLPFPVQFDIYGPVYDSAYWEQCQNALNEVPGHVRIAYHGELTPDKVAPTLSKYHVFLLPTLGESFGQAILESLASGCPVAISDNTPWRNLADAGVGLDAPLSSYAPFLAFLERIYRAGGDEYDEMRRACKNYIRAWFASRSFLEMTQRMFEDTMMSRAGSSAHPGVES